MRWSIPIIERAASTAMPIIIRLESFENSVDIDVPLSEVLIEYELVCIEDSVIMDFVTPVCGIVVCAAIASAASLSFKAIRRVNLATSSRSLLCIRSIVSRGV